MDYKAKCIAIGALIAVLGVLVVGVIYDMGIRWGMSRGLATAYEVCKKVAGDCGEKI